MSLLENCLEVNGRVVLLYIWNQSHWVNCLEVKSPVGFQDVWVNCPLDQRSGGRASVGLPSLGPISVRLLFNCWPELWNSGTLELGRKS